jgi:hypothetical protein
MKKHLYTTDCDAFVVQSGVKPAIRILLTILCISPAYAGIGDNFRVRLNGLTQWVGIKTPAKPISVC